MSGKGWYAEAITEIDGPRWRPTFVDSHGFESWFPDSFETEEGCIKFIDQEIVGAVRMLNIYDTDPE